MIRSGMQIKSFLLLLFLVMTSFVVSSQDTTEFSGTFLRPGVSIHYSYRNFSFDPVSKSFLQEDNPTYYHEIISATHFITERVGVGFTLQSEIHQGKPSGPTFNSYLQEQYGGRFSRREGGLAGKKSGSFLDNNTLIGEVSYRILKSRLMLMPRLLVGRKGHRLYGGYFNLVENQSGEKYELRYDLDTYSNDVAFTIFGAGLTTGYRLTGALMARIDVTYYGYNADFTLKRSLMREYGDEPISQTTVEVDEFVSNLSLGLGIIVNLQPRPISR